MTLTAITAGVAALILTGGFVEDIFVQLAESVIHSQSGHIQVARPGFFSSGTRSPERYLLDDSQSVRALFAGQSAVEDVMGRISFSGLLSNGRTDLAILGEGVEPDKETRLGTHLDIAAGRPMTNEDRYGMLIGQGVAKALRIKQGDQVSLLLTTSEGALNTLDFEVVGIFRSGSKEFDARAARIALSAAQEILGINGFNSLVIALTNTSLTDETASFLRASLPVTKYEIKTWYELNDFYEKVVQLYQRQFGVLQLIVLLAVMLSVANSVNMSAYERMGEFGTLMATGNRRRSVAQLIVMESAILGLTGAVLGVAVGIGTAGAISAIGIPMPPPPNSNAGYMADIRIVPTVVFGAFLIGFIATILSALPPALRLSRKPIIDLLQHNI